MAEWIAEAALAVSSPRRLMIVNLGTDSGATSDGARHEAVGSSTNSSIRVLVTPTRLGLSSDGLFGLTS